MDSERWPDGAVVVVIDETFERTLRGSMSAPGCLRFDNMVGRVIDTSGAVEVSRVDEPPDPTRGGLVGDVDRDVRLDRISASASMLDFVVGCCG